MELVMQMVFAPRALLNRRHSAVSLVLPAAEIPSATSRSFISAADANCIWESYSMNAGMPMKRSRA
jgi:hypothetical protein